MNRLVGLIVGLVLLALAATGAGAWTPRTDVTNWPDYECGPRTGCDSMNRIHMVWYGGSPDPSGWHIYYQMYNGATWTSPVSISGDGAAYPDIAVDAQDNLHVVWHAGGNPEEVYYRKCTAGVWGSIVNLSNTPGARSLGPRVAVNPAGDDILVVWHEDMLNDANWDIMACRYVNGSWGSPQNVSADSTLSRVADVVRDSLGNYHVAWEDTDTNHVYYRKLDTGGNWGTKTALDTNSGKSYGVALAVDPSNSVHAVWHDNSATDDWDITYRCWSGSWGSVVNISNNPGVTDCTASLDTDSSGNVYVAWQDYDNIHYNEKRGGLWGRSYVISSGTYQYAPCVTLDHNRRTHIVWQCRMPGTWDVYWSMQDFDLTPPPAPLGFGASGSVGKVYLSWTNPSTIDFSGTIVRCSTAGYPTSPSDGNAVCDLLAAPGSAGAYVQQGLTNGVTYYYSAFSYDTGHNYSTVAHAVTAPVFMDTTYAKQQLQDGQQADLYSKVISADFSSTDGYVYIQEPDRSSGLRVTTSQSGLSLGDRVSVSGTMTTNAVNGYPSERLLTDASVTKVSSGDAPKPFAMNCRYVGGSAAGPLIAGVVNGLGPNNIGQLVKIAGKVTYKVSNYIYVDDGSNVKNLYGLFAEKTGVMVKCPSAPDVSEQDPVIVTGIVEGSIPNNPDWVTNRAYVHVRAMADVIKLSAPTTGVISGTITSGGSGLGGVTVSTSSGGYSTTTSADGTYTLANLPPGTYTVTASKSGYASASQSGAVVTAGASTFVSLSLTASPGAIGGTVSSQGTGISGAQVVTSPGNYSVTTTTGGAYMITNVPVGTYTVTASKTGYITASQSGVVVNAGATIIANLSLTASPGTLSGTVTAQGGGLLSGAVVVTSPGSYSATTGANGTYSIASIPAGTYSLTASKTGYSPSLKTGVVVNISQTTTADFTMTAVPTERVANGTFESGFYNTSWATTCGAHASQLPNPSVSGWSWNNDGSYPFNTWDSSGTKHAGSDAVGFCFCQTASSPGKMGVVWQTVNLGAAGATATFSAWGYHTDGNCPTIMCWNPGVGQSNPAIAYGAGRYQWITTDNWGQVKKWVNRTMTVTADSSGYITIMVGGAAHPGTASAAPLYIDDVSVM